MRLRSGAPAGARGVAGMVPAVAPPANLRRASGAQIFLKVLVREDTICSATRVANSLATS